MAKTCLFSQIMPKNALVQSIRSLATHIRFCLKTQIFLCGLTSLTHVSGEYDHQKRSLSKTLPTEEIFENAVFLTVTSCYVSWARFKIPDGRIILGSLISAFLGPNSMSRDKQLC